MHAQRRGSRPRPVQGTATPLSPAGVAAAGRRVGPGPAGRVATVRPEDEIEIVGRDGDGFPIAVQKIVDDCPPHPKDDGRLCAFTGVKHVIVARERSARHALIRTAQGLAAGAAIAGPVACAYKCPSPWDEIVPLTALGVVLGALVVGAYFLGRSIAVH